MRISTLSALRDLLEQVPPMRLHIVGAEGEDTSALEHLRALVDASGDDARVLH
jgi:hypothetical protein